MEKHEILDDIKKQLNLQKLKWIVVWGIVLMFICRKDAVQQQQYEVVRQAYLEVQEGEYEKAINSFQSYIDGHTEIYWKFVDLTSNEQYGYKAVRDAIGFCEEKLQE